MSQTLNAGRRLLIAGNWKMHKTVAETETFATELLALLNQKAAEKVDILVCPTFVSLAAAQSAFRNSGVEWGGQNCHEGHQGAFTGEVSAALLSDVGCTYVIIGHSERRSLFGETSQNCALKIQAAAQQGLKPIYCVGETLEERKAGRTKNVIAQQLTEGLFNLSPQTLQKLVIAYEPVWAIGTGLAATSEQAEEVHSFIRSHLQEKLPGNVAQQTRILYGGSVKPGNANELLNCPNVDGGLIGGASLDAASFAEIVGTAGSLLP